METNPFRPPDQVSHQEVPSDSSGPAVVLYFGGLILTALGGALFQFVLIGLAGMVILGFAIGLFAAAARACSKRQSVTVGQRVISTFLCAAAVLLLIAAAVSSTSAAYDAVVGAASTPVSAAGNMLIPLLMVGAASAAFGGFFSVRTNWSRKRVVVLSLAALAVVPLAVVFFVLFRMAGLPLTA